MSNASASNSMNLNEKENLLRSRIYNSPRSSISIVPGGRTRRSAVRYKNREEAISSQVLMKPMRQVELEYRTNATNTMMGCMGSMQGWRKTMEDRHVIEFPFSDSPNKRNNVYSHNIDEENPKLHQLSANSDNIDRMGSAGGVQCPINDDPTIDLVLSKSVSQQAKRCHSTTNSPDGYFPKQISKKSLVSLGLNPATDRCDVDTHEPPEMDDIPCDPYSGLPLVPFGGSYALFGVFDGHRGHDAVKIAAETLPKNLKSVLLANARFERGSKDKEASHDCGVNCANSEMGNISSVTRDDKTNDDGRNDERDFGKDKYHLSMDPSFIEQINNAFEKVDDAILQEHEDSEVRRALGGEHKGNIGSATPISPVSEDKYKGPEGSLILQGTTAHVVIVTPQEYHFCNVGDSRGYLAKRRPNMAFYKGKEREKKQRESVKCVKEIEKTTEFEVHRKSNLTRSNGENHLYNTPVLKPYTIEVLAMSEDHRTITSERELERVKNSTGGFVMNHKVNGKLSVTRALGDLDLKFLMSPQLSLPPDLIQSDNDSAPMESLGHDGTIAAAGKKRSMNICQLKKIRPSSFPVISTPDIRTALRETRDLPLFSGERRDLCICNNVDPMKSMMPSACDMITIEGYVYTGHSRNCSPLCTSLSKDDVSGPKIDNHEHFIVHSPKTGSPSPPLKLSTLSLDDETIEYDLVITGCDGIWELQTADAIAERTVEAIETFLAMMKSDEGLTTTEEGKPNQNTVNIDKEEASQEEIEKILKNSVVESLNKACATSCDPNGVSLGCDNLTLGILVVWKQRISYK